MPSQLIVLLTGIYGTICALRDIYLHHNTRLGLLFKWIFGPVFVVQLLQQLWELLCRQRQRHGRVGPATGIPATRDDYEKLLGLRP